MSRVTTEGSQISKVPSAGILMKAEPMPTHHPRPFQGESQTTQKLHWKIMSAFIPLLIGGGRHYHSWIIHQQDVYLDTPTSKMCHIDTSFFKSPGHAKVPQRGSRRYRGASYQVQHLGKTGQWQNPPSYAFIRGWFPAKTVLSQGNLGASS